MAAPKKNGQQTVWFGSQPVIVSSVAIAGKKEGEGPLAETFHKVVDDPYYNEKSWEKAEQYMLEEAMQNAIVKANLKAKDIDFMLAGDLLNQIVSANYTARNVGIPFLGLYGACSTLYEGLAIAGMLIDGDFADYVLVGTASHYSTAERQYRNPVEHGSQKTMTTQRTVTGAGALVLARSGVGPVITHATIGKVVDLGETDVNNMGSAMAPAAVETIIKHLEDTGRQSDYYDAYITGDLGRYGRKLASNMMQKRGLDISEKLEDCGCLIFNEDDQDTHGGGSGCGCAAVVTCGHLLKEVENGNIKRFLGVGTGALMSPLSTQQGETIPGIAHAVVI
ncbi:MAG TPA: stage V sporulation protein AD, partial [Clostridia bacterium]|nr:stage V sporulation protein AD [Clostridia bacterium]